MTERTEIKIFGTEMLEKTVKPYGAGGAHVGVPVSWLRCKIAIIKLDG